MNNDLAQLHPYPFEKLARLKAGATPPATLEHIALSIGEPKHQPPTFVLEALSDSLDRLANYPTTKGLPELRGAISHWAQTRFDLGEGGLDAETQVLPVNGTREALFAFAQAVVDRRANNPLVVSPNPFYQIYEGAAFLAGAQPHFLACTADNNFIPDFSAVPASVWGDCQLLYLCTPGNPTGSVLSVEQLQTLIALADEHDFIIASDECYSELYFDEQTPPPGLLQACAAMGRTDYARCVVFHSLSKRSNLPGLRSGFVAGDADILQQFLLYRTYHGCAMPVTTQLASIAAWQDEVHVANNRERYRAKFDAVLDILDGVLPVSRPDAGFYLWPETPVDDETFARELFAQQNVTVLPGSYLARDADGANPGRNRVRMALVAPLAECIEAAERIKAFVQSLR
ncbi:succinyldiaminopimelate transaminase [Marinimicrobium alkaliphilum]|uniref:succinyldiaminopimelate transaminase n=1 Tax=Marinimicrobium alkaliphilum TaxID=2202654 RepID=UPI000DB91A49|nr:succinyldiaminopimelate transaminase [Marinimicrobium alkaliphilum]